MIWTPTRMVNSKMRLNPPSASFLNDPTSDFLRPIECAAASNSAGMLKMKCRSRRRLSSLYL